MECLPLQRFGTIEQLFLIKMLHNGKHYDKISERRVKGKRFTFYRLRFDDIKQVTGNIYLMETNKKFKELKKIKDKVLDPGKI